MKYNIWKLVVKLVKNSKELTLWKFYLKEVIKKNCEKCCNRFLALFRVIFCSGKVFPKFPNYRSHNKLMEV